MKNISSKIAIFDFCETLVGFQSADAYIKYVLNEEKIDVPKPSVFSSLLNKVCFMLFNVSRNKYILLKKIRGLGRPALEKYAFQFYLCKIKPALIKESVDYLCELKKKGYYIIIASAGFDIYIKHFANDMNVDQIICSEVGFKDEICTGRLSGADLIGKNKVKKLKSVINEASLKGSDSIAVSDSKSDMPLLNYCKKAVVVCKEKPHWAKNDMEALIWT